MQKNVYTLAEIANLVGGQVQGDPNCKIDSIGSLENARAGQISFLAGSRYQLVSTSRYDKFLATTKATAVILTPDKAPNCFVNKLIMDDPYQGYLKFASLLGKKTNPMSGIHPSAVIGENCQIASNASIGPNCVIGDYCQIGEGTCIEANVVIKEHARIGQQTVIHPNVTIYHNVKVGDRVIIHAGAVLGAEGFGLVKGAHGWEKIPHLGSVRIGNDVEIGANTTIDRGALDDTCIENGVKLDNLIMVGHGAVIDENTVVAGCVGIAGSVRIGKNCMIGGATGISDNITITDNVMFTGMSQVIKSITQPGVYSSGTGILAQRAWHKNIARFQKLDEMARKLKKLENEKNE